MNNNDLIAEEYQATKSGIETDRKRYDQMLLLAIMGILTVLGFSDKIPNKEIIPYLISPFLMIATLVATLSRQHQFFKTAFIIEAYEISKISKISYEQAYTDIFSSYQIPPISFKSIGKIFHSKSFLCRIGLFLLDPFILLVILLAIFSLAVPFIYGRKCAENVQTNDCILNSWPYIIGLVIMYSIIFLAVLRQKVLNIDYYRRECKKWITKKQLKVISKKKNYIIIG